MADYRNDGVSQSDIFQNKITKYLLKYALGRRNRYIKNAVEKVNIDGELPVVNGSNCINDDIFTKLPVLEQIEDDRLYALLSDMDAEGLKIVLMRAERGLTFEEIADELNANANSVRKKYNRLITSIRKEISDEFY